VLSDAFSSLDHYLWDPRYDSSYKGDIRVEILAVRPLKKDDPSPHPAFYFVLVGFSRDGKLPTACELGNKIRSMQSQNIEGLRFVRKRHEDRAVRWLVQRVC
jgi:hypothetical protein